MRLSWIRKNCISLVSAFCAILMLCVVPLVFRDAFFDINRIKVYAVYTFAPLSLVLMLLAFIIRNKEECFAFHVAKDTLLCFVAMALFLLSCMASWLISGFDPAVLLGNQGRYCGLLFFLCCGAAFYLIAAGALDSRILTVIIQICASVVALLGVLNAMGIDPLGFYVSIRKNQRTIYLSTIGHFDFFGTYMVMLLPFAASSFISDHHPIRRMVGAIASILMIMGATASRTESALLGTHMVCSVLLALSGDSFKRMSRSFIVWCIGFLSLPVVRVLIKNGAFSISFRGLNTFLCDHYIAHAAAFFMLAAAILCLVLENKNVKAPGKRITVACGMVLMFAATLFLLAIIGYFTFVNIDAELGAAASFLRFDDQWGTGRGFVFMRSIETYESYTLLEKLFGCGLDTTKNILSPYFDHPVIETYGIFDDAHNQILQLLLTGGLFAAAAFAAFYVIMLCTLYRHSGADALANGATASVFSYLIVILLNVTQPILIITYFSICGLSLSRIRYLERRRRIDG